LKPSNVNAVKRERKRNSLNSLSKGKPQMPRKDSLHQILKEATLTPMTMTMKKLDSLNMTRLQERLWVTYL
jgi:hypothetical protein